MPDESQLTPRAVLGVAPAALRGCGLSERKASYLTELAAHFDDGRLSDELLTSEHIPASGQWLHVLVAGGVDRCVAACLQGWLHVQRFEL